MSDNQQFDNLDRQLIDLFKNAQLVNYGEVVLSLKIHDSRIVSVTNSVTHNKIKKTRDKNV